VLWDVYPEVTDEATTVAPMLEEDLDRRGPLDTDPSDRTTPSDRTAGQATPAGIGSADDERPGPEGRAGDGGGAREPDGGGAGERDGRPAVGARTAALGETVALDEALDDTAHTGGAAAEDGPGAGVGAAGSAGGSAEPGDDGGAELRVLVERYELREPIGAGATGRVYAALDTRLGRTVAVKTLHPSLAHDTAFLSRFHREVSIAGKLSHANIVHVYDWGTDDGVPFLVTELLPGGSLAAFLERGGRLEVAQAAALGYQVARALAYAHSQGVIHRDIKPANLLFDEHGTIRVADFGLARALADATPTLPSEAVFGTLRYASPEQARADALDGRTDLYSLALVLVEAVTGLVPFAAESPAQMLWARTHQPVPAPFELGLLRPIVELAGQPDPGDRYADADDMARDLAAVMRALPAAEALPTAAGRLVDGVDPHPTEVAPIVLASGATVEDLAPGDLAPGGPSRHRRRAAPPTAPAPAHRPATTPVPAPARREAPVEAAPARTRSAWVAPILILAAVAVAALVAGLAARASSPTALVVPNVVGLSQTDAEAALRSHGLSLSDGSIEPRFTHDAPGTVIGQEPGAGARVGHGSTARLVVSSGPQMASVPDLSQGDEAAARAAVEQVGLAVASVTQDFDENVPQGQVLRQDPAAGASLEVGSTVNFVISNGPAPRTIPDVTNATPDAAKGALEGVQLALGQVTEAFSDTVPQGSIISQDPPPGGQVARGTSVNVVVSKGPDLVKVPDLTNLDLDTAGDRLQQFRLVVGNVQNFTPRAVVARTNPAAGTQVRPNSRVELVMKPFG
jgi:serine/threonine-protein kinase